MIGVDREDEKDLERNYHPSAYAKVVQANPFSESQAHVEFEPPRVLWRPVGLSQAATVEA